MNDLTIVAGISFLALILAGVWPHSRMDKLKKIAQSRGENPNQTLSWAKMKELDPRLFRQWKIGFSIQLLLAIVFMTTMIVSILGT